MPEASALRYRRGAGAGRPGQQVYPQSTDNVVIDQPLEGTDQRRGTHPPGGKSIVRTQEPASLACGGSGRVGGRPWPPASPKDLRHRFKVAVVGAGVPLNLMQRWLDHAQPSTTAIYADAVGEVDVKLAAVHAAGDTHDLNDVPYSFGCTQPVCALWLCFPIV
jgi:hypothetical protein